MESALEFFDKRMVIFYTEDIFDTEEEIGNEIENELVKQ